MTAPRRRKTVDVAAVINEANKIFRDSKDEYKAGREAIQSFVTTLLMDVKQYRGFNYLTAAGSVEGNSIGIIFDESDERKHVYPDQSRIFFFK